MKFKIREREEMSTKELMSAEKELERVVQGMRACLFHWEGQIALLKRMIEDKEVAHEIAQKAAADSAG